MVYRLKKHKTTVHRRYKDFEALFDLLLAQYPYRMVPKLPPKKVGGIDSLHVVHMSQIHRHLGWGAVSPHKHLDLESRANSYQNLGNFC